MKCMFRVGWGDMKGGLLAPASTCAMSGLLLSSFSDPKQELLGGSVFSYKEVSLAFSGTWGQ